LYGLASQEVEVLCFEADYGKEAVDAYTDTAFALLDILNDMSMLEEPRGSSSLRIDYHLPS